MNKRLTIKGVDMLKEEGDPNNSAVIAAVSWLCHPNIL
jgi:hypothetical protein